MTQTIHQRARLHAINARREVAAGSLTNAAANLANIETERAIAQRDAGEYEPWSYNEKAWFWGTVIVLVSLTALIVWQTHGATLPPDLVQAMKGVTK